tara:strand:- start:643 stop:840 length:198 start_codon:yes stop_codon:yes gene_type:complete
MKISDADKSSLLFKLFDKWKKRRLNKTAKKLLKQNPGLEKELKALDDEWSKALNKLQSQSDLTMD